MNALLASISRHQTFTWSRRRTAAPRVAIRCGWFFSAGDLVARGHVVRALEVNLHQMPVGVGEAIRPTVADGAVHPAEPGVRRLDGRDTPIEGGGALRPPGDCTDAWLLRRRQLQGRALVVPPRTE